MSTAVPLPPTAASGASVVPRVVDQSYAEQTLRYAVRLLGDVHAQDDDREDAGRVIQVLLRPACPTEADLVDLITALSHALHVHLVIRRILGALQEMKPAAVVEKVGRGVERLMDQAFRVGDYDALYQLVLVAFEEPRWSPRIRDEWGCAVFKDALDRLPEKKYPAALLVAGWLSERGEIPDWMRQLAEERPNLITSTLLPSATRWQLHTAAPSVIGWESLAGLRGPKPLLEPPTFGSALAVGVETLQQALGETTDAARKVVLGQWLHELSGTTT